MKKLTLFISIFCVLGCSEENSSKEDIINNDKDTPTPRSEITTINPNEVLAPQTCYYGCKARK